jgi:hypothetical protein
VRAEAAVMKYIADLSEDELVSRLNDASANAPTAEEFMASLAAEEKTETPHPTSADETGRGRPPMNRESPGGRTAAGFWVIHCERLLKREYLPGRFAPRFRSML